MTLRGFCRFSNRMTMMIPAGAILLCLAGSRCTSHVTAPPAPPNSVRHSLATLTPVSLARSESTECPAKTPLDCGNQWCCPRGYTMHCSHSSCKDVTDGAKGCYNPNRLTDEQLARVRDCCAELTMCSEPEASSRLASTLK